MVTDRSVVINVITYVLYTGFEGYLTDINYMPSGDFALPINIVFPLPNLSKILKWEKQDTPEVTHKPINTKKKMDKLSIHIQ